jgi:hypothetical protein
MVAENDYGTYSAQLKMRLIVNGETIRITHMEPDFLLVDSHGEHPPGDATIMMQVDQSQSQWRVRLPEGISRESIHVALALAE